MFCEILVADNSKTIISSMFSDFLGALGSRSHVS